MSNDDDLVVCKGVAAVSACTLPADYQIPNMSVEDACALMERLGWPQHVIDEYKRRIGAPAAVLRLGDG